MYSPDLQADACAKRLIRYLTIALLASPLLCACATTAPCESRDHRSENIQPSKPIK